MDSLQLLIHKTARRARLGYSKKHLLYSLRVLFLFLTLMTYYVYILYSKRKNLFYKGHTAKLGERLVRHNAGFEKATKSKGPWTLIWSTPKPNRSQAYQLEYKLKNLSRQRLIRFILKYDQGIAGPDEMSLIEHLSGC